MTTPPPDQPAKLDETLDAKPYEPPKKDKGFAWLLSMQFLLYAVIAVNATAVQLESRYFHLAGEPVRYWRSPPAVQSPECAKLLFWSSVASYSAATYLLLALFAFFGVFLVDGWKSRLFLLSSLALCAMALVHQLMFATSLD